MSRPHTSCPNRKQFLSPAGTGPSQLPAATSRRRCDVSMMSSLAFWHHLCVFRRANSSAHLRTSVMSLLLPVPLATSAEPPAFPPRWRHTATAQSEAERDGESWRGKGQPIRCFKLGPAPLWRHLQMCHCYLGNLTGTQNLPRMPLVSEQHHMTVRSCSTQLIHRLNHNLTGNSRTGVNRCMM